MAVTFRQMQRCDRCRRRDDPVCRFALQQLREAERNIEHYARGRRVKAPDIDVAATCASRDVLQFGHGNRMDEDQR